MRYIQTLRLRGKGRQMGRQRHVYATQKARETDRQTIDDLGKIDGERKRQTQKSTEIKICEGGAERQGRKTLGRDREEVPDKLRDRQNHLESRACI